MHVSLSMNYPKGLASRFPWSDQGVKDIRRVLGFNWDKKKTAWVSEGPEVLLDLERFGFSADFDPAALRHAERFREQLWEILEAKSSADVLEEARYAYQRAGTRVLEAVGNGILADDMGLGKTKQALDAIANLAALRVLVLAPKTLLYNWQAEVEKWHPELNCFVLSDDSRERKRSWSELPEQAIIIANYEKVRLNDWPLNRQWDVCIMDEGQRLKSHKAVTHKRVKSIIEQSKRAWLLTGTPLELNLRELYNIMGLLRPAVFGSGGSGFLRFQDQHMYSEGTGARNLELLRERLAPWMLRRTKAQVLKQLPPKVYTDLPVELSSWETKEYDKLRRDFKNWAHESGTAYNALTRLVRMRQFLCSPQLIMDTVHRGSKWEALEALVEDYSGRIVVFSNYLEMARLLRSWLGDSIAYIDGNTPAKERLERVNAFNSGHAGQAFVSTDAAQLGVTLTGADMVVHFNPLWNPQQMHQREDRLHRIGQKSTVQVINLLATKTLDYGMKALLLERQELFDSVVEGAEDAMLQRLGMSRIERALDGE